MFKSKMIVVVRNRNKNLINRPTLLVIIGVTEDPGDLLGHLIGVAAPLVLISHLMIRYITM